MDHHARRLVDHDQVLVLMDHAERDFLGRGLGIGRGRDLDREPRAVCHLAGRLRNRLSAKGYLALADQRLDPLAR